MQTAGSEERTHVDARMMRRWSDGLAAHRDGEGDGEAQLQHGGSRLILDGFPPEFDPCCSHKCQQLYLTSARMDGCVGCAGVPMDLQPTETVFLKETEKHSCSMVILGQF